MRATKRDLPERMAFNIDEVAVLLGVGRSTIFALIKEGQLQAVKIGSRTVISRKVLDAFLDGEKA